MLSKRFVYAVAAGAIVSMAGAGAGAQELVYEPINPSFGGNPFNSSHLLAIANAQNNYEKPEDKDSDVDRFIRSLQSRLLSSLSSQVAEAIFGEDAAESGRIVFGDQIIDFERTLDGIKLTITDGDGSTTVVTVPYLVTDIDAEGSSLQASPLLAEEAPLTGFSEAGGTTVYQPTSAGSTSLLEPLDGIK